MINFQIMFVCSNGVIDFDARYLLELDNGTIVYLRKREDHRAFTPEMAERTSRNEPADPSQCYMRVSPKFDVLAGPHEWIANHIFVGVAETCPNRIHYFKPL